MTCEHSYCGLHSRSDAASTFQVSVTQPRLSRRQSLLNNHTYGIPPPVSRVRESGLLSSLLLTLLHQERKGDCLRCCKPCKHRVPWRRVELHTVAAHRGRTRFKGTAESLSLALQPGEARAPLCIFALPLMNSASTHPLSFLLPHFSLTRVELPSVIFVSKENLIQPISSAPLP